MTGTKAMNVDEDSSMMLPPPSVLKREMTERAPPPEYADREVTPEMVTRYLQYECRYKKMKHKGETWGWLVQNDYKHFVELMCFEVPVGSNTFLALSTQLTPEDRAKAEVSIRARDTPEGKADTCNKYLEYTCTHKGRMNGKTWKEVRESDYSYFTWAVGNTMARETKTFKVFRECLREPERQLVDAYPKGKVKVNKDLKWNK